MIEEVLTPFDVRPHWGKLFTMSPAKVQAGFPKMEEFRQLLQTTDPEGKFRNGYLDRYVFGQWIESGWRAYWRRFRSFWLFEKAGRDEELQLATAPMQLAPASDIHLKMGQTC